MIAAIASAALIVGASLVVGEAVLALCGRSERSSLAGPVGLAGLLVVCGAVAGLGGRGTAIAISLGTLVIAALALLVWRRSRRGQRGRRGHVGGNLPQRSEDTVGAVPATGPLAPACAAAMLAALFAAIPFIAAGSVGILGVGLVNDDMASHLLLADWLEERFRPEPVLIDQGYPIGPHALVAGLATALGASAIDVFAGLTLAIPALTALLAFGALESLGTGVRIIAAALAALPYMAAAYLAQEAFKEPLIALFLLAFAILLAGGRSARAALPLGLLAAGAVYVYSFPGLAWLAGTAAIWAAIELGRGRRPSRALLGVVAAVLACLLALTAPELDRVRDFADFRALDPDRANEGGLGNLPGHLSPLEALGIWPTSEFRLSARASSLPAVLFYAGALLATLAVALASPRWLRRHGAAIPAALLTAVLLYVAARAFGTVYTSAKALAIAAPLIALITLGGLLGRSPSQPRESRSPLSLRLLAGAFMLAAAFSSFLILRQAPVAPEDHMRELAEIRPEVEGRKLLFLGRDNFVLYELRGSKPFTHVRNFYDPYFVEPNFELRDVGSKFDFDSVLAPTLERFAYVLTTRAAYASGPPPGYRPAIETESYVLWKRGGPVAGRLPGEDDAAPGRVAGCDGRPAQVATFARPPVLAPEAKWSETTIESGESATTELRLAPGPWEISLQYDATRPLTLTAGPPGTDQAELAELPGNLDYRGTAPLWAAGSLEIVLGGSAPRGASAVEVTATVGQPPLAGRLLGADSVAHLGKLAATPARPSRLGSSCRGYVDWYVE